MAPPNSIPDLTQINSMDAEGTTISIEDPHLQNPALSPQASPETSTSIAVLEEIFRNLPPNSSNSLAPSPCESPIRSTASIEDHNDNTVPIETKLYMYLINGDKAGILGMNVNLWEVKCKEDKNSVLHIAATAGQALLVKDIVPLCKDIIKWKNSNGDLAFHCAAKAAQLDALEALLNWDLYDPEASIGAEILQKRNEEGDTPLHIALENNQVEMARCLFKAYPQACDVSNNEMCPITPMYLAIKSGYWDLVKEMIPVASVTALMESKSVVHAAIDAKNIDILKELIQNHRDLIESTDDKHQTPLSYAALKGYIEGVQYLIQEFPECAYKCDEYGCFPIHKAGIGGIVKVVRELHCTRQLLNRKGQSILHVAALSGQAKVVSYLLEVPELERLINLKDEDGNTPLHLATKGFHPRVVYILTREKRAKLNLQNKCGLTALDVVEIHADSSPTFETRLTWMALRYVNAPQSSQSTRKSYVQMTKHKREQEFPKHNNEQNTKTDRNDLESFKDRIDTHLVVATLVATVTFAAGFTAPGGYKQNDPGIGMAVLADAWPFQVFIICNTAALYSSILSVVTLIWAHMGDLKLVLVSLRFALPLLGFALSMMSLAFMMGIFAVLRDLPWLSYVVLGMGSVFMLVVLVFFVPLYSPSYIRNPVVRFFFSGTFLLLLLVCEKSTIRYT